MMISSARAAGRPEGFEEEADADVVAWRVVV